MDSNWNFLPNQKIGLTAERLLKQIQTFNGCFTGSRCRKIDWWNLFWSAMPSFGWRRVSTIYVDLENADNYGKVDDSRKACIAWALTGNWSRAFDWQRYHLCSVKSKKPLLITAKWLMKQGNLHWTPTVSDVGFSVNGEVAGTPGGQIIIQFHNYYTHRVVFKKNTEPICPLTANLSICLSISLSTANL